MTDITVIPCAAALGADVGGVDLRAPLPAAAAAAIHDAWMEHLVLRFRGPQLSDDELLEFSRNFGTLDLRPVGKAAQEEIPGNPYITVISNVVEEGRPIGGLGSLEAQWHTDMSYNPAPALGSILHAWVVPEEGGNTQFCNMYRALEGLEPDLRTRIEGRSLKHDAAHNSVGALRRGFADAADAAQAPGATHPIIRRHPVTGRRCLYLGRRQDAFVVGLELAASEALLDELWAAALRDEHTWQQVWRAGDVVMWDNRCTLHRRDEFDNDLVRIMHRSQIGGDRVTA